MPSSIYLFLFCLICSLCFSTQSPTIKFISQQQTKNIGESVQLVCEVEDAEDCTIGWTKRQRDRPADSLSLSIGNTLSMKSNRYNVMTTANGSTTTCTFNITSIESSDMGIYECQVVKPSTEKITDSVELLVRHPPVILELQTTSVVTVSEGNPARLVCAAKGYPHPTISWVRVNKGIMPGGGNQINSATIDIRKAHKADRGNYYCIANNGVGNPAQKLISLEVEFPPSIRAPQPKVAQALEYDIEFECQIEAYPAPSVLWFKDNVQLINNNIYRITQEADAFEKTRSIVHIKSVKSNQYGDYFCNATNKMGYDSTKIHLFESFLHVRYPPIIQN